MIIIFSLKNNNYIIIYYIVNAHWRMTIYLKSKFIHLWCIYFLRMGMEWNKNGLEMRIG